MTAVNIAWLVVCACLAFAAFRHGKRAGYSAGFEKGFASGWIDRGLADWRKNIERRDRLGRFREKATR